MNFTTKRINSANAVINGSIALSKIEEKFEKVIKKIAKNIKIDGFRKGKVPTQVIKTRYKEQIDQDAQQEAIQELLTAALKELEIQPNSLIGNPMISQFNKLNDKIELEIKLGITPTLNLDNVEDYTPEVKLKTISKNLIDERLEEIAKNRAPLNEITQERTLQKDDTAQIDFEGFVDGKAFEGGKGENFNLAIGSNQFIPGFEDALIGMKNGEKRTIKVTFPEQYQAKHLAGKEASFDVTLHKILQKELPKIDDEFAKSIAGEESNLQSLKDMIKEQLEMEQKTEIYNKELKEKLVEILLKNISFDLPDLIVEQEMDILFRNALSQLKPEEFDKIKNNQDEAKKQRETHKDEARKSVQITFIMDALAKKYNIAINDNEVLQTIYYEAMMMGQDPKATLEHYQKNNLVPAIKMTMLEDRVLHYLLDKKFEESKANTNAQKDNQ
ncbi:trigger factor [Helicobacter hepaticus]|jgi:trigger factor|uniref:Trigger factor n=1 Tax=Helicobacter hepaticus (strain ATCC 51449 / 3B1) TaxID=235279 RepID=TIG_HELHP|nr:trigger factor [Helicobacter hepaticus]Q7VIN8.1 RecName: Full=Trigger factor; Short=TF; AltName: Full=PPIase [Helicobacter hepaticus ATCC 51449]AAP77163.1 FKBP-type peptidyl-prolyl cis-trans isomerase (trigger factor) [Helicobacter hepaticus ATCC 51449]